MDPNSNTWMGSASGLPTDITLLNSVANTVYEDDSPANIGNGVYNQRVAFINSNKKLREPFICGGPEAALIAKPMVSFLSTPMGVAENNGESHYSTPDGMFNSGYYFAPDTKLFFMREIVNHGNVTKRIYTVVDMYYIHGKAPSQLDSHTVLFDVRKCDEGSPLNQNMPKSQQF